MCLLYGVAMKDEEDKDLEKLREAGRRDRMWVWIAAGVVAVVVILGLLGVGPMGGTQSQQTQECTRFNDEGC